MYVYIYVCMYVCIHMNMGINICIYIYIYVHMLMYHMNVYSRLDSTYQDSSTAQLKTRETQATTAYLSATSNHEHPQFFIPQALTP